MGEENINYSFRRTSRHSRDEFSTPKERISYNSLFLRIILILIVPIFLSACGSSRKVALKAKPLQATEVKTSKTSQSGNKVKIVKKRGTIAQRVDDYIAEFSGVAQSEMNIYEIPASITLAQGILESGMGESRLAVKANNHFGIKCHKNWRGKKIYHDDDEKGECFRVYKSPIDSYRDHSLFLSNRNRYSFLFELKKGDYKGWAKGLKKAGYATDPTYSKKLIELIERFDLIQYDRNNNTKKPVILKMDSVAIQYKVKKGDTLYSISRRYNVSVEKIKSENSIIGNTIYIDQVLKIPNSK